MDIRRIENENETSTAGFTLVELLAVLVILAILAAAFVPSMVGFIEKAKQSAYLSEAQTACRAVQQYLIEEKEKDTFDDFKMYEDLMQYDIGDKNNALTELMKGSYTNGARITSVSLDRKTNSFLGLDYTVDNHLVTIIFGEKAEVTPIDSTPGK